jgi:hypothetical protein
MRADMGVGAEGAGRASGGGAVCAGEARRQARRCCVMSRTSCRSEVESRARVGSGLGRGGGLQRCVVHTRSSACVRGGGVHC